jgi:hypothetical protein
MTGPKIHSETTSVILGGSFNPRILEPLWLSNNGLVAEAEAVDAERQLIDLEFARMVLPWVELVVLQERLQAQSRPETVSPGQIRDLVVGILRLLPHTPVVVGSVHHRSEVEIATIEQWHAIGDALAPKALWEGVLDKPGLFDFAMQGDRPDELEGAIKVRIQPSQLIQPGIMLNVNDEFTLPEDGGAELSRAADTLEKTWPEAETRATSIRDRLLERLVS